MKTRLLYLALTASVVLASWGGAIQALTSHDGV